MMMRRHPAPAMAATAFLLALSALAPAAALASSPEPPSAATVEEPAVGDTRPRVDIDYHDGDLRQLLRLVSAAGFHASVLAADVEGKITLSLQDKPWDEALDVIARNAGLAYERRDKTIYVRRSK